MLAKFIPFHDLTAAKVANSIGISSTEVHNLCKGLRYPSPREIKALESLFGLPIEVLLEDSMLVHRDADEWPPHLAGFRPARQS